MPRRVPAAPRSGLGGSPFAAHLRALPDSALLDRLLRSRAWIVVIGIALGGIVAMQVSLLGMNAGISEAVVKTGALQQDRATLQQQISRLSDGARIRAEASRNQMILPSVGDATFLRAGGGDATARNAASALTPPSAEAMARLEAMPSSDTPAGHTSQQQLTAPTVAQAAENDPRATPNTASATASVTPAATPSGTAATPAPTATPVPQATAAAPTAEPVTGTP